MGEDSRCRTKSVRPSPQHAPEVARAHGQDGFRYRSSTDTPYPVLFNATMSVYTVSQQETEWNGLLSSSNTRPAIAIALAEFSWVTGGGGGLNESVFSI